MPDSIDTATRLSTRAFNAFDIHPGEPAIASLSQATSMGDAKPKLQTKGFGLARCGYGGDQLTSDDEPIAGARMRKRDGLALGIRIGRPRSWSVV